MNKPKSENYGFKNSTPKKPLTTWAEVDHFLETWGFLPNDVPLETLSKPELINLCLLALDAASRIQTDDVFIKVIQQQMFNMKIAPINYKKND
jgi:hypothetical protein